jgi:hypothetical protein
MMLFRRGGGGKRNKDEESIASEEKLCDALLTRETDPTEKNKF